MMARYTKDEVEESRARLAAILKPGMDVNVKIDHVARSGMTRWIECYVVVKGQICRITRDVAIVTGQPYDNRGHYGVEVGGCGMDMGFHLVYSLSRVMFRDGFRCAGRSCGSNDHSNPRHRVNSNDPDYVEGLAATQQPGYLGPYPRDGRMRHRGDGGYALNHRWI